MGTNDIDPALVETLSHLAWEASQQSAYTRWQDAESGDDQPPVVGWEDRNEEQREDTRAGVRSILRALRRRDMLTPAVPAEEETKAAAWDEGFEAGAEFRVNQVAPSGESIDPPLNPYDERNARYFSSPVVPAPTETGPWQRWEAVPDGVEFRGTFGGGSLTETVWVKRDGILWHSRPGKTVKECQRIASLAPFVAAAEEGDA